MATRLCWRLLLAHMTMPLIGVGVFTDPEETGEINSLKAFTVRFVNLPRGRDFLG